LKQKTERLKQHFDKVAVYPNPFTEQVTIDYATDIENVNSIELSYTILTDSTIAQFKLAKTNRR
jgi:glyoxylate carboligase